MKHVLIILFVCSYSFVFSQKSSLDYFNEASTLYIQNKKNDAFFHVKRALEIYENDARLSELYNLIKPEDEPPHQCQNPENDEQNEEGNQNNDGDSGSEGDNQQDSQEQSDSSDDSETQDSSQKSDEKDGEDSQQDDSASGASDEQKNNDGDEKNEHQKKDEKQDEDESREGGFSQINDANTKEQKEGQISTMEAEMLLRAIEDKDKELQIKLQQQKSQKSKHSTVEKDW